MTIYFVNTGIIPSNYQGMVSVKEITLEEVKTIINLICPKCGQKVIYKKGEDEEGNGKIMHYSYRFCENCYENIEYMTCDKEQRYISAIGHESTAQIMSAKTGLDIKMNRLNIEAKTGDKFICFQLKQRGEEGKIYTFEEMQNLECVWKLLEFYSIHKIRSDLYEEIDHILHIKRNEVASACFKGIDKCFKEIDKRF